MRNYSLTYTGVIVFILVELFKFTGINVGNEAIVITITTLIQFVAAIVIIIERFKKGGINIFGIKR